MRVSKGGEGKNLEKSLVIPEIIRFDRCLENWRRGYFNVLIIRKVGMGDVLMSAFVSRAIKRKYPESVLSFYTSSFMKDLLERFDWIDDVVADDKELINEPNENFDLVIDLRGVIDYLPFCNLKPRIDLFADRASVELLEEDYKFRFVASEEETKSARSIFNECGRGKKKLVLSTHAQAEIRTWEYGLEFADVMSDVFDVYLVHSEPVGFEGDGVYDLGGRTTVGDLVGLVGESDVVVSSDSGVMHLAGCMDIPFVGIFGPIPPKFRVKHYNHHVSLYLSDLECTPCWDWQRCACDVDSKFKGKTDIGHHWYNGVKIVRRFKRCMKDISVEMVTNAVWELLEGN